MNVPGVLSVTSSSAAALVVACPSLNVNIRVAPHTSGQETTISFARNTNQTVDVRGDMWILGRGVFSVGERNFGIGRFGADGGNALTITEAGAVNIPGSLTVGSVALQRIPYVSCRVDGPNVSNRGGQVVPSSSVGASGQYDLTITPPHPAGANLVPQVTLIGEHGYVLVNPSGTGQSLQIKIANVALAPSTLSFFLTIL